MAKKKRPKALNQTEGIVLIGAADTFNADCVRMSAIGNWNPDECSGDLKIFFCWIH
jgi:hypothetical protein